MAGQVWATHGYGHDLTDFLVQPLELGPTPVVLERGGMNRLAASTTDRCCLSQVCLNLLGSNMFQR